MRTLFVVLALGILAAGCVGGSEPAATSSGPSKIMPSRSTGGERGADEGDHREPDYGNISRLWGDKERLVVMDSKQKWHDHPDPVLSTYTLITQPVANPCVWQPRQVYFNNHRVAFDERHQTVWPGTARIEIVLTWTMEDSLLEELSVAYRPNRTADFQQTPYIKNGATGTISLNASHWDHSADDATSWEFFVCVNDSAPASFNLRWFYGSFHIKMTLVRGDFTPPPASETRRGF